MSSTVLVSTQNIGSSSSKYWERNNNLTYCHSGAVDRTRVPIQPYKEAYKFPKGLVAALNTGEEDPDLEAAAIAASIQCISGHGGAEKEVDLTAIDNSSEDDCTPPTKKPAWKKAGAAKDNVTPAKATAIPKAASKVVVVNLRTPPPISNGNHATHSNGGNNVLSPGTTAYAKHVKVKCLQHSRKRKEVPILDADGLATAETMLIAALQPVLLPSKP
jgi:hypothetical protein